MATIDMNGRSARPLLTCICILAALVGALAGCHPWGSLDNPADPGSLSYQGYDTVANASEIAIVSPANGGALSGSKVTALKVAGASAYGVKIAAAASELDSSPLFSKTDYASNVMDISASMLQNGTYYCKVGAAAAAKAGAAMQWSPATSFSVAWTQAVASPAIDLASGNYAGSKTISISCPTSGAEIRYTTDGSDPSASGSAAYSAALAVSSTCTLKARAYKFGMTASPIVSADYVFLGSPTITSATGGVGNVTPAWTSVDGATSYNLYYAQGGAASTGSTRLVLGNVLGYTLNGLSKNAEYAFVVTAVGFGLESAPSPVATATTTYAIGDTGPAGGIVFYDKGSYSDGWRYLESAKADLGTAKWAPSSTATGATSAEIGAGKTNTDMIVSFLGSGTYAARLCYNLSLGGYDDWFLPSQNELAKMYELKSTIGGFSTYYYFSSTEADSSYAHMTIFSTGNTSAIVEKTNNADVRPIREF